MVTAQLPPGKELRNLMTVLLSAVVFAGAIAGGSLWYYGAFGEYFLRSVLISPDLVGELAYSEKKSQYHFDRIELSYIDPDSLQPISIQVDLETYGTIYQILAGGKNVSAEEQTTARFVSSSLPTLTFYVKASDGGGQSLFQQVQFAPDGDLFRVELRQGKR